MPTTNEKLREEFKEFWHGKLEYGETNPDDKRVTDWWLEKLNQARQEERQRLADWIENHRGTSSIAIYLYMTTGKIPAPFDAPSDKSDRERCLVLLKAVPEWVGRLGEIEKLRIKGRRNGVEVWPWNEQIPLLLNSKE